MKTKRQYTVVGFYHDTQQQYCGYVRAATPQEAEDLACENNPTLVVAAVFAGHLTPVL